MLIFLFLSQNFADGIIEKIYCSAGILLKIMIQSYYKQQL